MGSNYEVEVTITSAKDLKNINWRHGPLNPYAVVWVDPNSKSSTRVDEKGDTCPHWGETLKIPFISPIEDSTLHIDIVHANAHADTKPLIGSARLPLRDVVDNAGLGNHHNRTLELKRPSGRPHGKLEVNVTLRDLRYPPPGAYPAQYGTRDYPAPAPQTGYGIPYAAPPPSSGYPAPPPPQNGYGVPYVTPLPSGYPAPPPQSGYGAPYAAPPPSGYAAPPAYGQGNYGQGHEEKKKSKFGGMGKGMAVGAAAGLLGGLAIAEGAEYVEHKIEDVEDKIAEDAADRVEDNLAYDDDDF